MKPLLLSILCLAAAVSARADLTIQQNLKQEGGPGGKGMDTNITMKVKGEKLRMDGMKDMTSIVDLKTGEVSSLLHQQKAVMTIPGEQMKKMQEARAQENPKIDPPKATGNKETINGYACEEYETSLGGGKILMWLTKDLPQVEKVMKELAQFAGQADPVQNMLKEQNISGFPMRTVMDMPGMGKVTVTVVALSEDPIPDSEFTVPSDYKPMKMPSMPMGQ
jgi:hypothetical protein